MKELTDGTRVPSRTYYYLLEWNDFDAKNFIAKEFSKQRLYELNGVEYKKLLTYAMNYDLNLI